MTQDVATSPRERVFNLPRGFTLTTARSFIELRRAGICSGMRAMVGWVKRPFMISACVVDCSGSGDVNAVGEHWYFSFLWLYGHIRLRGRHQMLRKWDDSCYGFHFSLTRGSLSWGHANIALWERTPSQHLVGGA